MNYPVIKTLSIATLAAAVAACGGGGSGSSSDSGSQTGTASLSLTDAPTAQFSEVVITFTGVTLKPADAEAIEFTFDQPKTLDLLTLQNGETATLLDEVEVTAGEYSWIRLTLDTDNMYVIDNSDGGGQKTLAVPSGAQTGLKLVSGFTVPAGGTSNFTIDFDARKSIVNPQGQSLGDYLLKPALRLVDNTQVGEISGEVDYATINSDSNYAACDYEGSVYVFDGEVAQADLNDLNVSETEGQPLMAVPVALEDGASLYSYTAAFLPEGTYTLSYSCQLDDNETDDTLEFLGTQTVTVQANQTAEAQVIPLAR